jgi:RNA polymerase sigma-70 factor (ECF subfamily)
VIGENVLGAHPFAKEIQLDRPHPSVILPAPPLDSEAAVVEACRSGNLDAYERLYSLHGPRMKSIALNLLGNTTDAEDAVQDAFLKIHRGLGNFRGQSAFSTWVYRIVVNACYDMRRRGLRRLEEPAPEVQPGEEEKQPPAPAANHPLRLALERAVGQLSETYRSVFVLYEVEGFSHAEIAGMLAISEGASKNRLFEAKRALRRMLAHAPSVRKEGRP